LKGGEKAGSDDSYDECGVEFIGVACFACPLKNIRAKPLPVVLVPT